MVRLEYKSLVPNEIIDYYLSIIKDEKLKKDFINTISKFDIRISTKPIIKGEEYYYYKIWIWRRGTKKKTHIKQYNTLESLTEEKSKTRLPSIRDILNRIRVYADVPDDFEKYCEISFRDPSDQISRTRYPRHLKRAKRFKKFITKKEIRSIPFLPFDDKDQLIKDKVAICGYGNNLSEVQMFYQVIPRSKMVDDYDVNSKMSFEQIEVEDKPLFVKQAWAAHLTMGFR